MGRNFAVRIPERQNRRKKGERERKKRKIIQKKRINGKNGKLEK